MLTNKPNKRWYDWDPTVSMAVSLLRNSSFENQALAINLIDEKGKEFNISATVKSFNVLSLLKKRWYDSDEDVSRAMEILKLCQPAVQKQLALDIINYLYTLEMEQNKS